MSGDCALRHCFLVGLCVILHACSWLPTAVRTMTSRDQSSKLLEIVDVDRVDDPVLANLLRSVPRDLCQFFISSLNCFPGHPHTIPVNIGAERGLRFFHGWSEMYFPAIWKTPSHPSILQPNTSASVISPLSSSPRCVPRFSGLSHGSMLNLINGLAWAEREHQPSPSAHHASEERRPFSDGTFPTP